MTGTARAAWLARVSAPPAPAAIAAPPFPAPDVVAAAGLALVRDGARLLQLAHEASLLVAPGPARRMMLHLSLAMLALAQDGTTTLPLHGAGRAALDRLLRAFDDDGATFAALDAMLCSGTVPAALAGVIGPAGPVPLLLVNDSLALHRFARLEERLAAALARQLTQPPCDVAPDAVKAAFVEVAQTSGFAWTVDQQRALLNAAHLPFTVVSGGPGTGKTTLVVSLLRLVARLGVDPVRIALAAPTGKAANRIFEEVRRQLRAQTHPLDVALFERLPEPRTLHRLLGYSPGRDRFGTGAVNPLDADVVVVDESSMVDLFLMERLFSACGLRPAGAPPLRLVLLGDANQLPSVEAGMVLHHLAEETPPLQQPWSDWLLPGGKPSTATPVPTSTNPRARMLTTLTWSHRMDPTKPAGKAIFDTAEAIRLGAGTRLEESGDLRPPARASAGALAFSHVEHLPVAPTAHDMARALREDFFPRWWAARFEQRSVDVGGVAVSAASLWTRRYHFVGGALHEDDEQPLRALLGLVESQRVLCLTRGRSVEGAERCNEWFAARRRAWGEAHGDRGAVAGFHAGEPVLFTVNDYALRLFNGYSGVVVWTTHDGGPPKLRAVFDQPRGLVAYDVETLREHLVHAWAMTVHKAQGSQVECAALLLPVDDASPLLVRQLVYTAVSRASHAVVLVGELQRLAQAAARPVERFSRVMERATALASALATTHGTTAL
jgi:exodeoxyribonuclease V alpha subunit